MKQLTQLFAEQPYGGASPFRASAMHSPEIAPIQKEDVDAGFSEKKSARIREGALADNSQVKSAPVGASVATPVRQRTALSAKTPAVKKRKLPKLIRRDKPTKQPNQGLLPKRHRI